MSKPLDDEVFDALLYVSRLASEGKARDVLKHQISSIVSYFDELEKFKDDVMSDDTLQCNSEKDLRCVLENSPEASTSYIEQKMLKVMNKEFMDGYFRTPKVLGSC